MTSPRRTDDPRELRVDHHTLRSLALEVDEEHRRSQQDLVEQLAATTGSRRRLLKVAAGSALATGVAVATGSVAFAAESEGGSMTPVAADTGSSPRRATPADIGLMAFAQSLELAAAEVYRLAIDGGVLSGAVADVATMFRRHHVEHAKAWAALLGRDAAGVANPGLLDLYGPKVRAARNATALLTVAFELENVAAATYLTALEAVEATQPAATIASILPTESRHAVVLGQALGLDADAFLPPFETDDQAVTPDAFPL